MTAAPLRILDLTDDLALMAGRLLVGIGADVVRIESTAGAPEPPAEQVHWHAGKRVIHAEPGAVDDLISRLVRSADVVLESGPVAGLRTIRLREAHPNDWASVAHIVVTPFGLTGPRAAWAADDTVAAAAGGMAWLGGNPGEGPVPPPREQATQVAGTHAAIAALLALIARKRTGSGQLVELSAQEAVAATLETGAISWIHSGTIPARTSGVYSHVAHRVFPTADGYVAGGYSGPNRMWDDLLAWMAESGEAGDLTDEIFQDPVYRWKHREHVDEVVTAFCRRRTTSQIAREGRERALPWAAVDSPSDLLENPQLAHRKFHVEVETGNGTLTDVGFPYESPALRRPVRLNAQHRVAPDAVWRDTQERPTPNPPANTGPVQSARENGAGALSGVRVLDLTWVLAGPYMTRTLADHGADIIKVESRHRQDPTRFAPSMRLRPDAGPDDSGYFLNFNRNKRSLALNLRNEAGPELLRRLAAEVDVIVENFSPGTLAKWGLGWEQLREINPNVVLVSMAGAGATGPWKNAVTFADTLAAMSGLTYETGGDGQPPQGLTFGLGDMVAANAATLAALEYLLRGEGGHVDLSQLEAMAAQLGTALLDSALPSAGTREAVGPLVLRTAGDDRWMAVGKTDAVSFRAAVGAILGRVETDPVASLTRAARERDADDLATALQGHSIAAYPVRDGRDLVSVDPQLAAREFYPTQEHALAGTVQVEGIVIHLTETPGRLRFPAPLLGQHTDELLEEILGLEHDQIRRLHDQGVLE